MLALVNLATQQVDGTCQYVTRTWTGREPLVASSQNPNRKTVSLQKDALGETAIDCAAVSGRHLRVNLAPSPRHKREANATLYTPQQRGIVDQVVGRFRWLCELAHRHLCD
jgi:hypothetical protein